LIDFILKYTFQTDEKYLVYAIKALVFKAVRAACITLDTRLAIHV